MNARGFTFVPPGLGLLARLMLGLRKPKNLEMVKSLGADQVIDHTIDDFTQSDETYDLILDAVVGKTSFSGCRDSLKQNGRYLAVAGGMKEMMQMLWTSMLGSKKVIAGPAAERAEDLRFLVELFEAGQRTFARKNGRYPQQAGVASLCPAAAARLLPAAKLPSAALPLPLALPF